MGDGDGGLGELLDGYDRGLGDPEPGEGGRPAARGHLGRPTQFDNLRSPSAGLPVACTLAAAAQVLGVPLAAVEQAAGHIEPYVHARGHPVWSLMLLERALGGGGRRGESHWRAENRATWRHNHGPEPKAGRGRARPTVQ